MPGSIFLVANYARAESGATSLTIRSLLPPGLFVTFFLGDDMGVIGNRIIMLCWMRGVLVDENSVHKSS